VIPGDAKINGAEAEINGLCARGSRQLPKRKKPKIVPRLGPPKNLRKAGAHEDKRRGALERLEDREQQELEDLRAIGSWAYDENE
jgi:hypothetical protein